MTRVAQEADALGYHSIWLYDHFHTNPTPTQEVTFECLTSTTALARDTRRVRLAEYEEAGIQELVVRFVDAAQLEPIRRFARECIQRR